MVRWYIWTLPRSRVTSNTFARRHRPWLSPDQNQKLVQRNLKPCPRLSPSQGEARIITEKVLVRGFRQPYDALWRSRTSMMIEEEPCHKDLGHGFRQSILLEKQGLQIKPCPRLSPAKAVDARIAWRESRGKSWTCPRLSPDGRGSGHLMPAPAPLPQ